MKSARRLWIVAAAAVLSAACIAVVVLIVAGRIPLGAESIEVASSATAAADTSRYAGINTSEVRAELEAAGLADVPENILATLSTLEKIDDYPIYTMRYFGPYIRASELQPEIDPDEAALKATDWACSLIAALGDPSRPMFGRSFDWEYSPILVLTLEPEEGHRSIMSIDVAYLVDPADIDRLDECEAEDLLGLLSAPFLTFDGMNEHGVAIGMAAVEHASGYSSDPEKRDIGDMQLMREILEAAGTVDEAIAFLEGINPTSQGGPSMHYLIADRTPSAALIEYHDGEMAVFRSSAEAPWQHGTNFRVVLTEGHPAGNCWRYDLIDATLREEEGALTVSEMLDLLADVSVAHTRWSIVYDLTALEMQLVIERAWDDVHTFSLDGGSGE